MNPSPLFTQSKGAAINNKKLKNDKRTSPSKISKAARLQQSKRDKEAHANKKKAHADKKAAAAAPAAKPEGDKK